MDSPFESYRIFSNLSQHFTHAIQVNENFGFPMYQVNEISTSHVVATHSDLVVHVPREGTPRQTDAITEPPPSTRVHW